MGSTDRATIPPRCMDCAFFDGDWGQTWVHRHPCQARVFWIGSSLSNTLSRLALVHCITSSGQQKNTSLGCKPRPRTQFLCIYVDGCLLVWPVIYWFLLIERLTCRLCFWTLQDLHYMAVSYGKWFYYYCYCRFWSQKSWISIFLVWHGGIWRRYHSRLLSILTVVHIGSKGKEENTCMLTIVLFFSGCLEALPPQTELNYIQNPYTILWSS